MTMGDHVSARILPKQPQQQQDTDGSAKSRRCVSHSQPLFDEDPFDNQQQQQHQSMIHGCMDQRSNGDKYVQVINNNNSSSSFREVTDDCQSGSQSNRYPHCRSWPHPVSTRSDLANGRGDNNVANTNPASFLLPIQGAKSSSSSSSNSAQRQRHHNGGCLRRWLRIPARMLNCCRRERRRRSDRCDFNDDNDYDDGVSGLCREPIRSCALYELRFLRLCFLATVVSVLCFLVLPVLNLCQYAMPGFDGSRQPIAARWRALSGVLHQLQPDRNQNNNNVFSWPCCWSQLWKAVISLGNEGLSLTIVIKTCLMCIGSVILTNGGSRHKPTVSLPRRESDSMSLIFSFLLLIITTAHWLIYLRYILTPNHDTVADDRSPSVAPLLMNTLRGRSVSAPTTGMRPALDTNNTNPSSVRTAAETFTLFLIWKPYLLFTNHFVNLIIITCSLYILARIHRSLMHDSLLDVNGKVSSSSSSSCSHQGPDQRRRYVMRVVRSPDGDSMYYNIAQTSIQRSAVHVLNQYMTDFRAYNPWEWKLSKPSAISLHNTLLPDNYSTSAATGSVLKMKQLGHSKFQLSLNGVAVLDRTAHNGRSHQQAMCHKPSSLANRSKTNKLADCIVSPTTMSLYHLESDVNSNYGFGLEQTSGRAFATGPLTAPASLLHGKTNTIKSCNSERIHGDADYLKKLQKRYSRLTVATEDAFNHIKRRMFRNAGSNMHCRPGGVMQDPEVQTAMLTPQEAAQALFISISRPLQRYLRIARLQPFFTRQSVINDLSICLMYDLSHTVFLKRYTNLDPPIFIDRPKPAVVKGSHTTKTGCWPTCCQETKRAKDSSSLHEDSVSNQALGRWKLVSQVDVREQIDDNLTYVLKCRDIGDQEISLLCQFRQVPLVWMSEQRLDNNHCKFAFNLNSETSV